jgi:hypothetical protein
MPNAERSPRLGRPTIVARCDGYNRSLNNIEDPCSCDPPEPVDHFGRTPSIGRVVDSGQPDSIHTGWFGFGTPRKTLIWPLMFSPFVLCQWTFVWFTLERWR